MVALLWRYVFFRPTVLVIVAAEFRSYGLLIIQISMNGIAPVSLEVPSTALNDGIWHELAVTQIGKVSLLEFLCYYD